jgi:quinol monooxygenase YgiN
MTAAMLVLSITAAAQEQLRTVTDEELSAPIGYETMIVRLAEIEVYPQYLTEYLEFANEVDRLSVEREPGVVCLFPMQSAEDSCQIRILEIYASEDAYQSHLKTDHFQKYKQGYAPHGERLETAHDETTRPRDNETDLQKTEIIYEDYHNHHRAATGSGERKCTGEYERECRF